MSERYKLEQTGPSIGTLFANTVSDVRKGIIPLRSSAAIDLKVSFSSVEVNRNGWNLIYVKQTESSSTLKMELATRIHTDSLVPPPIEELVSFVQKKLIASGNFDGPADGKRTDALDLAIKTELEARTRPAPDPLSDRIRSWTGSKPRFIGLLQILLKLPPSSCDGIYGPETEHAFVTRGIDYSLSDF